MSTPTTIPQVLAPLVGGFFDSDDVPAPVPHVRREKPAGAIPPSLLTDELEAEICDLIEGGTFPHVAAQSVGIAPITLSTWRRDPRPRYVLFAERVAAACGKARASAERRVHMAKPEVWLRVGPGRDRGKPDEPGWTDPAVRVEGAIAHAHLHASLPGDLDLSRLDDADLAQLVALTTKAAAPALAAAGGSSVEVLDGEIVESDEEAA